MLELRRNLIGGAFCGDTHMATRDTLIAIVNAGSDLTLFKRVPRDLLDELASAAQRSGAKLTLRADIPSDVAMGLAQKYGKSVAFIDGAAKFEKE